MAVVSRRRTSTCAKDPMGQVTDKALPASEWTVPAAGDLSFQRLRQLTAIGMAPAINTIISQSTIHHCSSRTPTEGTTRPGTTRWLRITPRCSNWSPTLTNNTVARYNWITPNIHNDMHSSLKTDFALQQE